MSIKYDPSKLLRKIAPKTKIKKLLKKDLTVNRAALSFVSDVDFISKSEVTNAALKVAKNYQARVQAETATSSDLRADPAQMIQRVQNEVVLQIAEGIKEKYSGEFYIWLPSDAEEPDPLHSLNYGKEFIVGKGEMPGDRWGCRCGMEILVKETKLKL